MALANAGERFAYPTRGAALALLALCLTSCHQGKPDNSSPLSPKPLPDFTFDVQISPNATERLAENKSHVVISVLPLKVADKEAGEEPDWWSWITMGPARDVWVTHSGDVVFSGLKVKSRFLGNGGYDKIIANVNTFTGKYEADQISCTQFDVSVAELSRTRRVINCTLNEEWRQLQAQEAVSKAP